MVKSRVNGNSIIGIKNNSFLEEINTIRSGRGVELFEINLFLLRKALQILDCFFISYKTDIVFIRGSQNRKYHIQLIAIGMRKTIFLSGIGSSRA
jgi:hypothetical protein